MCLLKTPRHKPGKMGVEEVPVDSAVVWRGGDVYVEFFFVC